MTFQKVPTGKCPRNKCARCDKGCGWRIFCSQRCGWEWATIHLGGTPYIDDWRRKVLADRGVNPDGTPTTRRPA